MLTTSSTSPVILTIAGFDPSGGAGLIADIRTILAFDCTPVAAMTSLTFQNSEGVFGAIHQTAESLRSQILSVVGEFRIGAVKIGMLPTRESVSEVARLLRELNLPAPVVDPVLRATSGYELAAEGVVESLLSDLMPLARLITPNIPEAETLTGLSITTDSEMQEAAAKLRELGARAVLLKGGHLYRTASRSEYLSRQAIDVLDDGDGGIVLRDDWIDTKPVRGTGCMVSSAIAACLGREISLEDSVRSARKYVRRVMTSFGPA